MKNKVKCRFQYSPVSICLSLSLHALEESGSGSNVKPQLNSLTDRNAYLPKCTSFKFRPGQEDDWGDH